MAAGAAGAERVFAAVGLSGGKRRAFRPSCADRARRAGLSARARGQDPGAARGQEVGGMSEDVTTVFRDVDVPGEPVLRCRASGPALARSRLARVAALPARRRCDARGGDRPAPQPAPAGGPVRGRHDAGRCSRIFAATSSTTSHSRPQTTLSMSVLARLDDFRGLSRFTTWVYKFALLEAAVKLRRRAWQGREVPLEPDSWDLFSSPALEPGPEAEQSELLERRAAADRRVPDPAPAARPRRPRPQRRSRSTFSPNV